MHIVCSNHYNADQDFVLLQDFVKKHQLHYDTKSMAQIAVRKNASADNESRVENIIETKTLTINLSKER